MNKESCCNNYSINLLSTNSIFINENNHIQFSPSLVVNNNDESNESNNKNTIDQINNNKLIVNQLKEEEEEEEFPEEFCFLNKTIRNQPYEKLNKDLNKDLNKNLLEEIKFIELSFSFYFIKNNFEKDFIGLFKKGNFLKILISKFNNNQLILFLEDFKFNLNINLKSYYWYHLILKINKNLIYCKVIDLKNLEILLEENFTININNLDLIYYNYSIELPITNELNIIPFKGFIKHLNFLKNKEFLQNSLQNTLQQNLYPPIKYSNTPISLITEPIYNLQQLNCLSQNKFKNLQKNKINLQKRKENSLQKVILCHDMKGGYIEDKYLQGSNKYLTYNFNFWQYIDIFIYFSHQRISIPPVAWVDIAHKNGVAVLGNFIVEWEEGLEDLNKLLNNYKEYSKELIKIQKEIGLDGWFFNIESSLKNFPEQTNNLIKLLKFITMEMHNEMNRNDLYIIWYDSVIESTGDLKWQNELNDLNFNFFNACDGIFLNYGWKPNMLKKSVKFCNEKLCNDVTTSDNNTNLNNTATVTASNFSEMSTIKNQYNIYTGIDIFGRGQYGGGKFNTYKALHEICKVNTSIALFAPGYTFESYPLVSNDLLNEKKEIDIYFARKCYEKREDLFWTGYGQEINLLDNEKWDFCKNDCKEEYGDWLIVTKELNDTIGWISNYKWCKMSQIIDLDNFIIYSNNNLQNNLQKEKIYNNRYIVNENQPLRFTLNCWYKGTPPNCNDLFYLKIEFRNSNNEIISKFETGELISSNQWKCIYKNFILDKRIKYIYWEHGGKDVENWAGHYGTRISNCSFNLVIENNHSSITIPVTANVSNQNNLKEEENNENNEESEEDINISKIGDQCVIKGISDYIKERPIPYGYLNTNFCNGVGLNYFLFGKIVKDGEWNNLRNQEILPTYRNVKVLQSNNNGNQSNELNVTNHLISFSFDYKNVFIGGSSLLFKGKFNYSLQNSNNTITRFKLFKTNIPINCQESSSALSIEMVLKRRNLNSFGNLILITNNGKEIKLSTVIKDRLLNNNNSNNNRKEEQQLLFYPKVIVNDFDNDWKGYIYELDLNQYLLVNDIKELTTTEMEIIGIDFECEWCLIGNEEQLQQQLLLQNNLLQDFKLNLGRLTITKKENISNLLGNQQENKEEKIIEITKDKYIENKLKRIKDIECKLNWSEKSLSENHLFVDVNIYWKDNDEYSDRIYFIYLNDKFIGTSKVNYYVVESVDSVKNIEIFYLG
ncbi:hypothetical protein ABK040_004539 [Willaertia magna]